MSTRFLHCKLPRTVRLRDGDESKQRIDKIIIIVIIGMITIVNITILGIITIVNITIIGMITIVNITIIIIFDCWWA